MLSYDKSEVKEKLDNEDVFQLLLEWGGEPEYTSFGIISATICHNEPGVGSHKLYYYYNSQLFRCYTGCDCYFDIFELVRKIANIQWHEDYDLNDAIRWIAAKFGISGTLVEAPDDNRLEDWEKLANYDRIKGIVDKEKKIEDVVLKEYDPIILDRLNYRVKLVPWLKEGISEEAMAQARIGFYPGNEQITIPHFDKDDRFIGLRGRTLCKEEAERFGKYRPAKINRKMYNHPLGMNLYNYNFAKDNIKIMQKAIVFEGEKSCLLYKTYFGIDNDISVACCGSSVSAYQIHMLIAAGAKEIIIAFDRQFQEIGDKEFEHLKNNLLRLRDKYKNDVLITFIFDKHMITGYKDSPIDCGKEIFLQLFKERIVL